MLDNNPFMIEKWTFLPSFSDTLDVASYCLNMKEDQLS